MSGTIDLKELNLEELSGVVSIYPWYAGARKELCRRMAEMGSGAWSDERYAEAALYFGSRRIAEALAHGCGQSDCSDKNVSELIKSCIGTQEPEIQERSRREFVFVGGDYFSQDQYKKVQTDSDRIFSSFASGHDNGYQYVEAEDAADFCTETLAQIYLDQEYYDQAIEIYSKLSLRYPEKSVYFAALIEKIKNR